MTREDYRMDVQQEAEDERRDREELIEELRDELKAADEGLPTFVALVGASVLWRAHMLMCKDSSFTHKERQAFLQLMAQQEGIEQIEKDLRELEA